MVLGVLLVLAVVTTLGLSLSKKTEVETKIDTDEALLKQAFNNAESGIDYYLSQGTTQSSLTYTESGGGKAEVSMTTLGNTSTVDSGGMVTENENMMFWLVGHDNDGEINYSDYYSAGTFQVCIDDGKTGSIKVDYFYKDGSDYKVDHYGFNLKNSPGVSVFTDVASVCTEITVSGTPLLVAVTPIIGDNKITLKGADDFPKQGVEISSVGRAGDLTSGVNTKVKVQDRYEVPAFMLEAVAAGGEVKEE